MTARHGFVPVQDLVRLDSTDDGRSLIALWTREDGEMAELFMNPERDSPPTGDEIAQVNYYAPMRDALLISQPLHVFKDLLVPRAGSTECEVWTFAKEGAGAYRSFAAFLRTQLSRPDRRPNPELADLYASQVRDGNRPRLHDLAEIADSRVAPLAFAYMLDPTVDEFMKRGWAQPVGKLADPPHHRLATRLRASHPRRFQDGTPPCPHPMRRPRHRKNATSDRRRPH